MARLKDTTIYGGLSVDGDVYQNIFHGKLTNPLLADIQEKFPQEQNVKKGDIVEMKNGVFVKQNNPYNKNLKIVSSFPAVILQEARNGKEIQLNGSVPVNIKDIEKQKIGDKVVLYKNGLGKTKKWYDFGKKILGQIFQISGNKAYIIVY